MSELAILAGVGNATLYRRYPSLGDVIEALYLRHVDLQQEIAAAMVTQPTGWDAVVTLVRGLAETMLEHPAIPRVTRKMIELNPTLRHGEKWDGILQEAAHRAHEEGSLRPDVDSNDITLAAFRMGDYVYYPEAARGRIIARQVTIVLDGLRADAVRTPMPGSGISTTEIQGFWREQLP